MSEIPNASNAKALLSETAELSAKVVSLAAKHRHCFSATQPYAQLVFERLTELRESCVGDCQRLGIFIERRFKPTVRYCAVTEQRLDVLAKSVANLGELLQARVQVEMEEQNAKILKSPNARADAQIKIQRAVEGLSIIAITYYVLNLLKLLYSGAGISEKIRHSPFRIRNDLPQRVTGAQVNTLWEVSIGARLHDGFDIGADSDHLPEYRLLLSSIAAIAAFREGLQGRLCCKSRPWFPRQKSTRLRLKSLL